MSSSNNQNRRRPPWHPWSFRRLPAIAEQVSQEEHAHTAVAAARMVTRSQVQNGHLAHLGVYFDEAGNLVIPVDPIVPGVNAGVRAGWNMNGKILVRRDLPKETRTIDWEGLAFGQYPTTFSKTGQFFQRQRIFGNRLGIRLNLLADPDPNAPDIFILGARVMGFVATDRNDYNRELLFRLSFLQEQFGAANAYLHEPTDDELLEMIFNGWTLLPPELRGGGILHAIANSPTRQVAERMIERMTWILEQKPGTRITLGLDGFSGYFLAHISENCVIAEHMMPGNAVYIFGANWQTLTRRSRTWLRENASSQFVRIEHDADDLWKARIQNIMQEAT